MTRPAHGAATVRSFGQKPHVQKADCQLAAKGAANAAMEVNFQDRSKSAERSRRPLPSMPPPAVTLPIDRFHPIFARRCAPEDRSCPGA